MIILEYRVVEKSDRQAAFRVTSRACTDIG
jgi:hypothetical protein